MPERMIHAGTSIDWTLVRLLFAVLLIPVAVYAGCWLYGLAYRLGFRAGVRREADWWLAAGHGRLPRGRFVMMTDEARHSGPFSEWVGGDEHARTE